MTQKSIPGFAGSFHFMPLGTALAIAEAAFDVPDDQRPNLAGKVLEFAAEIAQSLAPNSVRTDPSAGAGGIEM